MSLSLMILICLNLMGLCVSKEYSFDSFDFEEVLNDPKVFHKLLKCIEPKNECTGTEQRYVDDVIDAGTTLCAKCSPRDKSSFDQGVEALKGSPIEALQIYAALKTHKPDLISSLNIMRRILGADEV